MGGVFERLSFNVERRGMEHKYSGILAWEEGENKYDGMLAYGAHFLYLCTRKEKGYERKEYSLSGL